MKKKWILGFSLLFLYTVGMFSVVVLGNVKATSVKLVSADSLDFPKGLYEVVDENNYKLLDNKDIKELLLDYNFDVVKLKGEVVPVEDYVLTSEDGRFSTHFSAHYNTGEGSYAGKSFKVLDTLVTEDNVLLTTSSGNFIIYKDEKFVVKDDGGDLLLLDKCVGCKNEKAYLAFLVKNKVKRDDQRSMFEVARLIKENDKVQAFRGYGSCFGKKWLDFNTCLLLSPLPVGHGS